MYYSDYNRPQNENSAPAGGYYTPGQNLEPPQPPKKHGWVKATALVLACALAGGGAGVGGAALYGKLNPAQSVSGQTTIYENATPTVVKAANFGTGTTMTAADVYASNVNACVGITTQVTTNVWGQQVASAASGSGFVLTSDGYIITNHHVIDGATSITVNFYNGDSYPAKLVGSEEENDIAVLKIEATGLTPVVLGSSDELVVGEDVVAIGNPLGELTFTMTAGIVSALDRTITMSDGTAINMLQTDTAINSGNSGGPLFNMQGAVIGITSAKYSSSSSSSSASIEGLCFAIPIDDVKDMIFDIIEHGYVTGKPYMGVTLATANAANAAQYGRSGGAYVQSVVAGGPADQAGLESGDIITAIDGESVDGHAAVIEIKNTHKAGDTVTLTIDRGGKKQELSFTFGEEKPEDPVGQVITGQDQNGNTNSGNSGSSGNGYNYWYPFWR